MKTFLITTAVLLFLSLVCTVVVFWYLSSGGIGSSEPTAVLEESMSITESVQPTSTSEVVVPDLDTEQKEKLEAVGIDPESFVVTTDMIDCALSAVGEERMNEIAAGANPTLLESAKLLPCAIR